MTAYTIITGNASNAIFYDNAPRPGWVTIGEIRRADGFRGALVQHVGTGIYAQANAGALRTLDQRQVARAMGR